MTVYRGGTIQVNVGAPNEFQTLIDLLNDAVADAVAAQTAAATSASNIESFVVEAEGWANTPEDTLVPDGDGVDDYSALHHAAKAAASATAAATSETNAETAATNAQTAETNAELAETNAEAALASFQSIYYGESAADPATDDNGDAPTSGDLYWNTTSSVLKVYDGAAWADAAISSATHYTKTEADATFLHESSNLSDLDNTTTARSNLGLGSLATGSTAADVPIADAGLNFVATNVEAALAEEADARQAHAANVSNPHAVTKTQVGLSNVTNDAQLKAASNLSDVASAATSRTNLDVYSKAEADAQFLDEASNLSDLTNAATAVTNLGFTETAALISAGAIVESGTNANGTYWRWSNGLQIATRLDHSVPYSSDSICAGSWTYPAAFVDGEIFFSITMVTGGVSDLLSEAGASRATSPSTTSVTIQQWYPTGTVGVSDVLEMNILAIGKWK